MKTTTVVLVIALVALPSCGGSASEELFLDQDYTSATPSASIEVRPDQDVAQTFIPSATGFLVRVDVMLAQTTPGGALSFDIRPTTGGAPEESDTNVMVSVALPDGMVPATPGMYTFDLQGLFDFMALTE